MKFRHKNCYLILFQVLIQGGFFGDAAYIMSSYQSYNPWKSPIQYNMDGSLSAKARNQIPTILDYYFTAYIPGLVFVQNGSLSTTTTGYAFLYFRADTTSSLYFCENETVPIGQTVYNGANFITLVQNTNIDCGGNRGWILHLLLHAFGFYHEHQRIDRANYIYINNFNINSTIFSLNTQLQILLNTQSNGVAYPPSSTSYDYESVMHYHYTVLASTSKITIVPLPPYAISWGSYGQATNIADGNSSSVSVLSSGDIAALQALFPTPAGTSIVGQYCQNGGTFYNWCACPIGFSGRYCEKASCIRACQNGGTCVFTSGYPKCSCPTGYGDNFCETDLTRSTGCSSFGGCPFWSLCVTNTAQPTCNCDPFPYQGTNCSTPFVFVNTTTTSTTTSTTASTTSATSTLTPTATFTATSTISPTTTPVGCSFGLVIPTAKPRPFSTSTLYLRIALTDIYYLPDYSNLQSTNSTALQAYLWQSLNPDYTTQSSGKFVAINLVAIQPPYWGESTWFWNPSQIIAAFGCIIVDYTAVFSVPLTPKERQQVLGVTARYAQTSVPVFHGRFGNIPLVSTRVSGVGYITPQNLVLTDTTPCTIYAAESACQNGGQCTSYDGVTPSCLCMPNYSGDWCQYWVTRTVGRDWPVWLIVFAGIGVAILLLIVALVAVYCMKRAKQRHSMWFPPTSYQMYGAPRRRPTIQIPRFIAGPDQPVRNFRFSL